MAQAAGRGRATAVGNEVHVVSHACSGTQWGAAVTSHLTSIEELEVQSFTSICSRIAVHAEAEPDGIAVAGPAGELTYQELTRRASASGGSAAGRRGGPRRVRRRVPGALARVRRGGLRGALGRRRLPSDRHRQPAGPRRVRARRQRHLDRPHLDARAAAAARGPVAPAARRRTRLRCGRPVRGSARRRTGGAGLRHLHLRQHRAAEGRRADPREPGQPHRLAHRGLRGHRAGPGEPGRRPRFRRRGLGDLAAPGRRGRRAPRRRRHPALPPSCCATGWWPTGSRSPSPRPRWPSS